MAIRSCAKQPPASTRPSRSFTASTSASPCAWLSTRVLGAGARARWRRRRGGRSDRRGRRARRRRSARWRRVARGRPASAACRRRGRCVRPAGTTVPVAASAAARRGRATATAAAGGHERRRDDQARRTAGRRARARAGAVGVRPLMPQPQSRTTTTSRSGSAQATTRTGPPLGVAIGMQDGVGDRLADGQRDVGPDADAVQLGEVHDGAAHAGHRRRRRLGAQLGRSIWGAACSIAQVTDTSDRWRAAPSTCSEGRPRAAARTSRGRRRRRRPGTRAARPAPPRSSSRGSACAPATAASRRSSPKRSPPDGVSVTPSV